MWLIHDVFIIKYPRKCMFYTTTVCEVKHIDSKKCSLLFGLFIYINIYIYLKNIYIYKKYCVGVQ